MLIGPVGIFQAWAPEIGRLEIRPGAVMVQPFRKGNKP
jgi:hypothetical protein